MMTDQDPAWESDPGHAAPVEPPSDNEQPAERPEEGLLARVRWGLISFITLSIIVIVLAAQNTQSVTVKALGWEAEAPLIVIILITVLVSVILDELVGVIIRRRRQTRRREREELNRLRRQAR